jgi:uncharacterized protein YaiL (DUF2058 family)
VKLTCGSAKITPEQHHIATQKYYTETNMAGSLQDQLLGAGLINKKKAKKIKNQKHQAIKKSRKTNTELTNEAALLAEKAIEDERRRSRELNEQRKREAEKKAIAAQIRQIIEMNSIEMAHNEHTIAYNFTDRNIVKTLHVSEQNHNLVGRGRIAIAKLDDTYYLIPKEAANKIIERESETIVLLNDSTKLEDDGEVDDPYADYQVPDDLMW